MLNHIMPFLISYSSLPQFFRCPKEPCKKGKPFTDQETIMPTTTTIAPEIITSDSANPSQTIATETVPWTAIPPIQDQICIQAGIKEQFFSNMGNYYCQMTCLFQQMDKCNLFLCYCNTKFVTTKGF